MLPSGLPEEIGDEEEVARFLTQSNQFTRAYVKPAAFLPSPKGRETSVSRHGREPAEELWRLGRGAAGARTLYGAALVEAKAVRAARLSVTADEPPPRHAVIRDWPWHEDRELQKAQQKDRANVLAQAAGEPVLYRET